MKKNLEMQKCINFLVSNGWKDDYNEGDDYISFYKNGYLSIDVGEDELVILADEGDTAHLPLNKYALIGYLFDKRQIDCGYKNEPSTCV